MAAAWPIFILIAAPDAAAFDVTSEPAFPAVHGPFGIPVERERIDVADDWIETSFGALRIRGNTAATGLREEPILDLGEETGRRRTRASSIELAMRAWDGRLRIESVFAHSSFEERSLDPATGATIARSEAMGLARHHGIEAVAWQGEDASVVVFGSIGRADAGYVPLDDDGGSDYASRRFGAEVNAAAATLRLVRRTRRDNLENATYADVNFATGNEISIRYDFGAISSFAVLPSAIEITGESGIDSRRLAKEDEAAGREARKSKHRGFGVDLLWESRFGETAFHAGRREVRETRDGGDTKTKLIHAVELWHRDAHDHFAYALSLGARHGPDLDDTITGSGVRIGFASELRIDPPSRPRLDLRAGFGHWRSSEDLGGSRSIATTWALDGSIDFGPMLVQSERARAPRLAVEFGANGGHGDHDLEHADFELRIGIGARWRF